jgi:hypothetical protein
MTNPTHFDGVRQVSKDDDGRRVPDAVSMALPRPAAQEPDTEL